MRHDSDPVPFDEGKQGITGTDRRRCPERPVILRAALAQDTALSRRRQGFKIPYKIPSIVGACGYAPKPRQLQGLPLLQRGRTVPSIHEMGTRLRA